MKSDQCAQPVLGIRVSKELEAGLKALAAREGESMATIVRASIRQTIARGGVDIAAMIAPGAAQMTADMSARNLMRCSIEER